MTMSIQIVEVLQMFPMIDGRLDLQDDALAPVRLERGSQLNRVRCCCFYHVDAGSRVQYAA